MDDRQKKTDRAVKVLVGVILALVFAASAAVLVMFRFGISPETLLSEPEATAEPAAGLAGNRWQYLDGGREPGAGNLWTTGHYDAGDWQTGSGRFAADAGALGSGAGVVLARPEEGGAATYFFRRAFTMGSLDDVEALRGTIRYSDAVLVYLNGTVIFAGNVPEGGYETNQSGGCAMDPGAVHEDAFLVTDLTMLREGTNVLAVELHQSSAAGRNAFFQMVHFGLLNEEVSETPPQLRDVFLEQGDGEGQVFVNWLTGSDGYYALEYMTAKEYAGLTDMENGFHLYAARVLMGRTYDEARDCYLDRAPISHLKAGEEYLCRVVEVGSGAASDILRFTAAGNNRCAFAVLGGRLTAAGAGRQIDMAADKAGGLDFLVSPRSLLDGGQEPARHIPARLIPAEGADCFPFQDTLVVVLGEGMVDAAQQEAYVRRAMETCPLSWTVVVMPGDKNSAANGEKLRQALDVDMVVDPSAQDVFLAEVGLDGPIPVG